MEALLHIYTLPQKEPIVDKLNKAVFNVSHFKEKELLDLFLETNPKRCFEIGFWKLILVQEYEECLWLLQLEKVLKFLAISTDLAKFLKSENLEDALNVKSNSLNAE